MNVTKHVELQVIHYLEEFLCRLDCGEIVGCFLLIDAEGVAEKIHGRLHVIVPGV